MTSARKKKKQKEDTKASEHMVNWLTKPKKPQSHPVSFKVFKQVIENLPDIAFEIQIHELGFNLKTLDECANWYYNAFYTDPSVRTKYQYTLRPCPLGIREKLLRLPEGVKSPLSSTPSSRKIEAPSPIEEEVVVSVKNCGLFQFPVSFATFDKYFDSEKILKTLMRHWVKVKTDRKAMLEDEKTRRLHLRKYYNAFYVYPHKRNLDKYNFKNAPTEMLPQLLKSATPLDERAKMTMLKATRAPSPPPRVEHPASKQQSYPANSLTSVVSFPVFEKNVKNLYDIVWQLKLHEPAYESKGFEDCAFAYYLAFYLTPEIRKKYPPELRYSEASLHDRILAVPSQSDVATLQQMRRENGDPPTTQDLELQSTNEAEERSAEPRVQDQLLERVKSSAMEERTIDTDKVDEPILIPIEGITYQYPVSFETFIRSINIEELKPQLFHKWKRKDTDQPSENRLLKCFYHTFYVQKKLRRKFNYNFNSAPPELRRKLNGMAIPLESKTNTPDQAGAANVISTVKLCEASEIQNHQTAEALSDQVVPSYGEQDVVVDLAKVGRFRLPVSFETFERHINYDELIKPLLSRVIQDESELITIAANPLHQQCIKIFRRYYNSFYVRPYTTRGLFKYRFENASEKLIHKLKEFAVPLDDSAKNVMAQDAKMENVVSEQPQLQHQLPDEEIEIYPVSLKFFKKYITNLDSIVKQMQGCAEYKDKSTSECELTYYKAFYKDASIREKFEYRLKACPAQLRRKILGLATSKKAKATKPIEPQAEKPVEEVAKPCADKVGLISKKILIEVDGTIYEFPVSMQIFKRYINYDKIQNELAKCYSNNENVLSGERSLSLLRRLYHSFYIDRKARNICKFNFNAAPVDVRLKLLQFAVPVKTVSKETAIETRDLKCKIPNKSATNTFKESTAQETTKMSTQPTPPQVVSVISTVDAAVASKTKDNQAGEALCGQSSDKDALSDFELNVIVNLSRVGRFRLPVSFESFKRYINYNELIKPLLARVIQDESQLIAIAANPFHQQCIKIFRRYYNSFYVRPHATRCLLEYRFENASEKLIHKLKEFAVPLDEAAKRVMAEDARMENIITEQSQQQSQQQIPDEETTKPSEYQSESTKPSEYQSGEPVDQMANRSGDKVAVISEKILIELEGTIYEFPVSLQTFKRYINYDIIQHELANCYSKNANDRNNFIVLQRFYHSFYTDRKAREVCNFNFDAAPIELRSQLLQFAAPVEELQPEEIESDKRFPYPVSFNMFSKLLNLDEVVQEMQQEPKFAGLSEKQCMLAYYEAFYRTPEIRNRFQCIIKPCPGILKAKLLEIPAVMNAVADVSRSSSNSPTFESLAVLYAARKAELEKLQKENIVDYVPHNLADYIARSTQSLCKRALLEKHFIAKNVSQEAKEIRETVTATIEATKESVQQSAENVADIEGIISNETTTQDMAKRSATSHDTAMMSASSSSSTFTRSSNATDVNPEEQSQQTKKPSTVALSQASTSNVSTVAVIEKSSRDSIAITNRATAQIFFSKSGREHNMKYLLFTSHGLMKTVWRTLAQLSYPEFITYTGIYEFIEDEYMLRSFYDHVIKKGNWPLNLYVKLPLFRQLLRSKGIQVDTLDFGKLSPKILHWHELIRFSNFDDIVESEYKRRTGSAIDDLQQLFGELDQFYTACWQSDQWICRVPQIQADKKTGFMDWNDTTSDVSESNAEPMLPPCLIDDEQIQESTETISADDLSNSECPATQLNASLCPASFVDMNNVCPASQAVDSVDDPLLQQTILINQIKDSIRSQDEFIELDNRTEVQNIKEEPINFPNMLRFDLVNSSNEDYQCEPILTREQIINLDTDDEETQPVPEVSKAVKEEPVQFLNAMRFDLNSSSNDSYQCERIPTEEQIIDLDNDQSVSGDLACFVLPEPNRSLLTPVIDDARQTAALDDKYQDLLRELQEFTDEMQTPPNIRITAEDVPSNRKEDDHGGVASNYIEDERAGDEVENLTVELLTTPREPNEEEQRGEDLTDEMPNSERVDHQKPSTIGPCYMVQQSQVSVANPMHAPPVRPQAIKKKLPCSYPSKRPRLNADFVPQLRHAFRPLPLHAMVRIETEVQTDVQEPEQPSSSGSASGMEETNPMTASQELSTDNTLMSSSQLQCLLDAPFVTQRKVNANEDIVIDRSDNTDRSASASPFSSMMLHTDIVFRCLQRYMYFDSLTTAQISKYQINSLSVGSSYQQALIYANGKLCNVYGPLLENLFPHCMPSLMTDFRFLLSDVGEFSYNSRRDLTKNSKEDLRLRVLDMFMRTAPAFTHLHLRFENESQSWADCTPINDRERDFQLQQRKPSCNLSSQIRPEILEQMRELKNSLYFK